MESHFKHLRDLVSLVLQLCNLQLLKLSRSVTPSHVHLLSLVLLFCIFVAGVPPGGSVNVNSDSGPPGMQMLHDDNTGEISGPHIHGTKNITKLLWMEWCFPNPWSCHFIAVVVPVQIASRAAKQAAIHCCHQNRLLPVTQTRGRTQLSLGSAAAQTVRSQDCPTVWHQVLELFPLRSLSSDWLD